MESAKATLRFLKIAPRKVRLVADMIRGENVETAISQLTHSSKIAARPVRKLIESAAANAVHNEKMQRDALIVQTITVDDGPTAKRSMPRAHGRATVIRKRTSHVNVILMEKPTLPKEEAATPPEVKKAKAPVKTVASAKKAQAKSTSKKHA
ncbi:TPA: 50S ribosomal protein L22 [Candidatus Uhrbacteria bacterium]|nr:50S ribosomal protein L22 [Candidatus Uhrbacteria bacterium]